MGRKVEDGSSSIGRPVDEFWPQLGVFHALRVVIGFRKSVKLEFYASDHDLSLLLTERFDDQLTRPCGGCLIRCGERTPTV